MEDRKIEIARVSSLKKSDKFMLFGSWKLVTSLKGGSIYFKDMLTSNNRSSLPSNSNQYVEIERKIV